MFKSSLPRANGCHFTRNHFLRSEWRMQINLLNYSMLGSANSLCLTGQTLWVANTEPSHRKAKPSQAAGLWIWCWWEESNLRPTDYESVALPTELHQHRPAVYQIVLVRRKLGCALALSEQWRVSGDSSSPSQLRSSSQGIPRRAGVNRWAEYLRYAAGHRWQRHPLAQWWTPWD